MKLRIFLQAHFAGAESPLLCSACLGARIFEDVPVMRRNFVQFTGIRQIPAMQLSIYAVILPFDSKARKGPS